MSDRVKVVADLRRKRHKKWNNSREQWNNRDRSNNLGLVLFSNHNALNVRPVQLERNVQFDQCNSSREVNA